MKAQGDDEYTCENAKLKFYYTLKNMGIKINGGDGYFYYMKKKEDFLSSGKP